MEEVERCPGCGANLALVRRVHRCVAKPPVSNVTEVLPNKPDVIAARLRSLLVKIFAQ